MNSRRPILRRAYTTLVLVNCVVLAIAWTGQLLSLSATMPVGVGVSGRWVGFSGKRLVVGWPEHGPMPAGRRVHAHTHLLGSVSDWTTVTPNATPPVRQHRLAIDLWLIMLGAAVAPITWLTTRLRRLRSDRRVSLGLCARCGYDLRSSPQSCPECGAKRP